MQSLPRELQVHIARQASTPQDYRNLCEVLRLPVDERWLRDNYTRRRTEKPITGWALKYVRYEVEGHLHRSDGPAQVRSYNLGSTVEHVEIYFAHGQRRAAREGPYYILWENGICTRERFFENGRVWVYKYSNGSVLSEEHYAAVPMSCTIHLNSFMERIDDLDTCYVLDREDGPAYIFHGTHGVTKHWFSMGLLHRVGGPAIDPEYADGKYYYHGLRCSPRVQPPRRAKKRPFDAVDK